jgi:predicted nucleotidyltransferase
MDITWAAVAYRRRADQREARRLEQFEALRSRARRMGTALREAFGPHVRVYLFGSLLDVERFRGGSDIDLGVEGLGAGEYWDAWRMVEPLADGASVDLVRLETAAAALQRLIRIEGEVLA